MATWTAYIDTIGGTADNVLTTGALSAPTSSQEIYLLANTRRVTATQALDATSVSGVATTWTQVTSIQGTLGSNVWINFSLWRGEGPFSAGTVTTTWPENSTARIMYGILLDIDAFPVDSIEDTQTATSAVGVADTSGSISLTQTASSLTLLGWSANETSTMTPTSDVTVFGYSQPREGNRLAFATYDAADDTVSWTHTSTQWDAVAASIKIAAATSSGVGGWVKERPYTRYGTPVRRNPKDRLV